MADSPKIPLLNKPGVSNWVERYHALPKGSWIRRTAEHLQGKGMADGRAIAVAVNAARRGCASGDLNFKGAQQVNAKSRAEMCAAYAVWKAAAARAKASKDLSAEKWFRAIDLAGPRLVRGLDLTDSQSEVLDLAEPRMKGLYDVAATVKRLRKNSKLKNLSDEQLQRIAVARILRRQLRNRLGITDLKKLPKAQVRALEKAGLVGGRKAAVGTTVSYTLQRGPRKGQTIQVRNTASGWHEVKAR